MENPDVFNHLPDALCIIDGLGNVKQANDLFQKTIVKTLSSGTINFINDILHSQHLEQFGIALEKLQTNSSTESQRHIALGALKTLTLSKELQSFPIYRLIDWSISLLSSDAFIVSGRDPAPMLLDRLGLGSIGAACVNEEKDASCVADGRTDAKKVQPFDDMTVELIDFFQKAPISLHWLSGTGTILWANETELESLGYSAEEYIGHSITEFLMPGEETHLQEVFGNLAVGNTIHDAPFRFQAKNGDVKYLIVDSNVNFNEDGSFRHTRCFIRNDTDRRVREEILLVSNRIMKKEAEAKSTFIRHVFHEMRTPLHVLSNFLGIMSPSPEDFDEMRHHTDSTLGMVDDLTFATTFEAGKLSPLEPRVMNLHSVLMQVKDAVNAVEQKGGRAVPIRIDMQVPAECQNVMVDVCLTRVLYSLLSNAVRYSPITGEYVDITIIYSPGSAAESYETAAADVGCKRVRLATDDSAQKVQIGDFKISFRNSTVVPINLELVRNFFSYYYHFESLAPGELSVPEEEKAMADMIKSSGVSLISKPLASSTASGVGSATKETFRDLSSVKGLGLGLYTSYNMIKILGGHLECSTEGPNQASFCFTLSLPLTSEAAGTSVKRSMLTSMPSIPVSPTASIIMATDNVPMTEDGIAIKAMRVLVVDDSSMCQKVIVKSLKGLEFYTDVASNGKEACDKLQEVPCKFDAVLMDLRMPVMDGLEAIRYSRNVLNLSSLPIIALTAEIGPSIKEEAMKAGASHFLNKPAKGQDIINILKSLMMSTTSA